MSSRRKTPAERKATRRTRHSIRRSPYSNVRAMVNPARLAPNNSYSDPEFLQRGYYLDQPFTCCDCGKAEIWTASQQKWWYEIARGAVFTQPLRCRPCRRHERERSAEARRVHLEGKAVKSRES